MKKVGLITIHGICNFGSVFQTYALQKKVESFGYDCEVINYKYPNEYHKSKYIGKNPYANVNKVKETYFDIWRKRFYYRLKLAERYSQKMVQKYKYFVDTFLKTSSEYPTMESLVDCDGKYDIYLTGSDQVWNPRYLYEDVTYLLPFTESKNKIAFSASFGTSDISDEYKDLYRPLLSQYKHISTREQSGTILLNDICSKPAQCTCDPTLLLNGDEWRKLIIGKPLVRGKFILCYVLKYTSDPYPYASDLIEYIRKQLGYKVVCIDDPDKYWLHPRFINKNGCGPLDLLNLFENASFIISSSFHGAAFSINLKKDFYSILPPNINDERQESFLKKVGAEDRIIRVGDPMPNPNELRVKNWDEISNKLNDFRKESLTYLENALNDCSDD